MNFNFIASDKLEVDSFTDVESFVDNHPTFQTVNLVNEEELKLLLNLIGINEYFVHELSNSNFSKYWNLTSSKFPEFSEDRFEQFYNDWLKLSKRENNMDEYGNLIFLQGLSEKWNKLNCRLIVQER